MAGDTVVKDKTRGVGTRWRKLVINILIILLIYIGVTAWFQHQLINGVGSNGLAPDLRITDMAGESVEWSGYGDRPVLLHFWGTWCSVCAAERSVVNAVDEDWDVLSVALQSGDTETLRSFLQQHQISWRTVNDPNGSLSQRYAVKVVPTSFILKNGRIIFAQRGYITGVGLRLRLLAAKYMY